MAVAGSLTYSTSIDTSGYNKGISDIKGTTQSAMGQIKNIVVALGIDKVITATMDTIKESVSSAMSRIDTMEQFARVMTAMTGSAEEAKKALNDINATVKGTAYGLDVAAKSTQKFVTSGMDLNKATKQVKTWADAVAFYGDGTNATFENVTDALSKMVSKGKVEMDQLNRLTDAGIPAVQIYADSVGKSVQEVQDDLSNGVISAEEFMDGLSEAFNNGTERFASITNAAKEAGASWSATFDNMRAAVARGSQSVIESIETTLNDVGISTMKEIVAGYGSVLENGLKNVASKIPDIIGTLKNAFDEKGFQGVTDQIMAWVSDLAIKISEKAPEFVGSVISIIGAIGSSILENLPTILQAGINIVLAIAQGMIQAIPLILPQITLFLQQMLQLIQQNLPTIIETVIELLMTIIDTITENLPQIVIVGIDIILALATGLIDAIPDLIAKIPEIIVKLALALTDPQMLLKLASVGPTLMMSIAGALIKNIPTMITAVPQVITGLFNGIKDRIKNTNWLSLGKNVLKGILNGMLDFGNIVKNTIKKLGKKITDSIKSFFGIKSPSKLMKDEVGKWIPAGIAVGIDDNTKAAIQAMKDMNDEMVAEAKKAVNLEAGDITSKALVTSAVANNQYIQLNATFTGQVDMDGNKVGKIITPSISRTLKTGGLR